ncbi:MAG: hypothetical protein HOQ24_04465 [Mycobacteriaceae bacterium]|nr:hypothetical protein [Mycobacteriaceae bacterium]
MAPVRLILAALAFVGLVSGCSGKDEAAPGPVLSGADGAQRLREVFAAAMTSKKTVVITSYDEAGDGSASGEQTCKVRFTPAKASACEAKAGGAQQTRVISMPDALYVFMPDPGENPGGKPWRRIDPNGTNMMAQLGKQIQHMTDETLLTPGVSTVTGTHADKVDGKRATRYELSVDVAALTKTMLDHTTNDLLRGGLQDISKNGAAMTAQIWIGADNLPLKQVTKMSASMDSPAQVQTMTYGDWGAPLTIAPPPADQVSAG